MESPTPQAAPPKKRRRWRFALYGFSAVILAGILGVVMIDNVAAATVRHGGTYALGVDTEVEGVRLDLGSNLGMEIQGLTVANPEGFDKDLFFGLGRGSLDFPLSQVLADTLTVPELKLEAIEINLERSGLSTNYGAILDNLARFESGEAEPDADGGKAMNIARIVLQDVSASIDILPVGGEATSVTIDIPEIVLTDVGNQMSAGQVISLVIKTILTAVLQNAGGILPDEMLQELGGMLGGVTGVAFEITGGVVSVGGELLEGGVELIGEGAGKVGEGLGKVGEGAGKAVKGVGEAAGDAVKGLGGLLGGKKDDD